MACRIAIQPRSSRKLSEKKLADMDIEEFMAEDFGSDDDGDEDDVSSEEDDSGEMEDEQSGEEKLKPGSGDDDDDDDEDEEDDDDEEEENKRGDDKEKVNIKTSKKVRLMKTGQASKGTRQDVKSNDNNSEEGSEEDEEDDESASEEESDENPELMKDKEEKTGKAGNKLSAIDQHKQSIENLKDKDPDFYKFLQENDQELLNFEDDEEDSSDDDDDDDEDEEGEEFDVDDDSDEEGALHKLPTKLQEASDEEDVESEEEGEEEQQGSKVSHKKISVTIAMVDKWGDQLEDGSLQAFRELTEAFKSAVQGMPDEGEEEMDTRKYVVPGSNVFNAIISLCLKGVHPMLESLLNMDANATKRLALPSSCKKWKTVYNDVKEYLTQVTQLLSHMVDPAIVCVVLRHIHKMIPYYCCFPKMTRSVMKKLVPLWSTSEETVRVVAFLALFSIPRYMKKPQWLELILKQMYMAYVKNTKFTSPSTLPLITFMQRSLTEMFALNTQITYQHAFVYIRQLAIHLRNAITIKKDQYQSVYNWQYIHCVWLWCRVLGTLHTDESLQPLIYPLVQTAIGVIKLIPAAKYIPLRFSIIRALNILSDATDTFIPLIPHILDVFELVNFNQRPVGVSYRPLNFAVVLKLSAKQMAEKGFKDGLMDEMYELLLEHLVIHSHSISFPELALPVILRLKAFIKGSRVPSYSKIMKGLLDKIQENCKEITQKRNTVTFGLADDQATRAWENKIKEKGTILSKLYTTYKPLRERELKTEEAGKDRMLDMDLPTVARNRERKMKDEDKADFKELFENDSDSEEDILVRAEKKGERMKTVKKKRGKKRKLQTDENFSSDDDDEDDYDSDFSDDDDFDDDEDSDDLESGDELDSDGDLKVNKGAKAPSQSAPSVRTKESKKSIVDDDMIMDGVEDVVEDFQLWSDDEGEDGGDDKKGKKSKTKNKGKKGKSKGGGQGGGKKMKKFGGKEKVKSKKAKLEGKV